MNTASYASFLPYNRESYKIARVAAIARSDTLFGGARALMISKHCKEWDAASVVADVYSRSSGMHSPEHEGWECSECGSVHLGQALAMECCAENDSDTAD